MAFALLSPHVAHLGDRRLDPELLPLAALMLMVFRPAFCFRSPTTSVAAQRPALDYGDSALNSSGDERAVAVSESAEITGTIQI